MTTLMGIVFLVCALVAVVASVWLLVVIFKEGGALWGLGSVFVPFVSLIFVITNWEPTKKPFLISLGAMIVAVAAMALGGGAAPTP